jgi:hypothetical protein
MLYVLCCLLILEYLEVGEIQVGKDEYFNIDVAQIPNIWS